MIKINDKEVNINYFPDGTLLLKDSIHPYENVTIRWYYDNNEELIALYYLVRHLQENMVYDISLEMPYIPNARQDRVKNAEDILTLKYFAEIINALNFRSVTVLDPHSSVAESLIDNIFVENPKRYILEAINRITNYEQEEFDNAALSVFYPDEGAMKRYSGLFHMPYTFGIKRRNWETGNIDGLEVVGDMQHIVDSNVVIIDDICSRGGTFFHSAKKLKELGAKNIYLYVTHCEKSIFSGQVFSSGLITKIFTTDTIFREDALNTAERLGLKDKIGVIRYEPDKSDAAY